MRKADAPFVVLFIPLSMVSARESKSIGVKTVSISSEIRDFHQARSCGIFIRIENRL